MKVELVLGELLFAAPLAAAEEMILLELQVLLAEAVQSSGCC